MINFPLAGNVKIKDAIVNCLKEKRLPHAILIEGDAGVGRHTLANYIALSAVCEADDAPCGVCRGCLAAKSGNHPDIAVVAPEDGKKNISVAQIRALKAGTAIKPHSAKAKVFIIDKADSMNEQSQNALLKVLEEPPGAVYFILIAESKASLLNTVISRCVTLTLSPPEPDAAAEYISSVTNFPLSDIREALASAQNNVGRALLLLGGESDTQVSLAASGFLDCMFSGDGWGMLCAAAGFEKSRRDAELFFKELKYQAEKLLRKNLNSYKAKSLSLFYSKLCELEKSLNTNINLSLLFCTLTSFAEQICGR